VLLLWGVDGTGSAIILFSYDIYPTINTIMPRLSLYKPEKGNDYKFMDRTASEMFQVGGTDLYLHKYLGPELKTSGTSDQPVYGAVNVTNIQDLLFLENRDRKYDTEIYRLRGHYSVSNIDFNLSQFGLFIDNDTIYMTVHINDIIHTIGRKPVSGDVFELPHLRDNFALNDFSVGLPRYYVIEDVGRASEGFSATWYPHLYRLKCKKVADNQQFAEIFNQPARDANGDPMADGTTLRDLLSTHSKELQINDQVVAQAEADAPKSGYETRQFYTLAVDTQGKAVLNSADQVDLDASNVGGITAGSNDAVPNRTGYTGYLVGDGFPVNGYDFGFGIQFPSAPAENDFFLRTDFLPNRLFRFDATRWVKVEDAVRMNMTNNDSRSTLKTGFINNNYNTYNDQVAVDYVKLDVGATIINTTIPYVTAPYVTIKYQTTQLEYDLATYPTLISSYQHTSPIGIISNCVRITLPYIANIESLDAGSASQNYEPTNIDDGGTAYSQSITPDNILDDAPQQTIPFAGAWTVTLWNYRESQRQSLSTALKPKADL
jgi:hypothetical protein